MTCRHARQPPCDQSRSSTKAGWMQHTFVCAGDGGHMCMRRCSPHVQAEPHEEAQARPEQHASNGCNSA
eukprot:8465181-Lingulodinium_polyedra.AAC.1